MRTGGRRAPTTLNSRWGFHGGASDSTCSWQYSAAVLSSSTQLQYSVPVLSSSARRQCSAGQPPRWSAMSSERVDTNDRPRARLSGPPPPRGRPLDLRPVHNHDDWARATSTRAAGLKRGGLLSIGVPAGWALIRGPQLRRSADSLDTDSLDTASLKADSLNTDSVNTDSSNTDSSNRERFGGDRVQTWPAQLRPPQPRLVDAADRDPQ